MKPDVLERRSAIAAAAVVLGLISTSSAVAEHRCRAPQDVAERRACAAAQQGPTALRRYVQRTQSIYHLDYYDYAPRDEAWWRSAEAPAPREMRHTEVAQTPQKK